jgi:hypothetical protein
MNKSTAADRYAKGGGRVAMDAASKHEDAHRNLAAAEYKKLEGLRMRFEHDLKRERHQSRRHAAHAHDAGMVEIERPAIAVAGRHL